MAAVVPGGLDLVGAEHDLLETAAHHGGSASSLANLDILGLASDWRRRQENRAKATIIFIFMKYVIVNSVAADCLLLSQNEFYRPVISTIWTF